MNTEKATWSDESIITASCFPFNMHIVSLVIKRSPALQRVLGAGEIGSAILFGEEATAGEALWCSSVYS